MIRIFLAASYIHICGRRNPNLDQCIVDSVRNMKDKLCVGIPELSVPSIDPVIIDKIAILDSPNSKLHLSNLIINGLCDYNVSSLHMDLEQNRYDLVISFRHLLINATYEFDIRLLVPIAHKGNVFITTGMWNLAEFAWENQRALEKDFYNSKDLTSYFGIIVSTFLYFPSDNINTKTDMEMKIVTKNDKRYVYMSHMKIDIDIKNYNVQYDLNDKELSELRKVISTFIGNNQHDVIAAFKTPLERTVSKRILELSNNIVKHFTYDELFPDRVWITFLTFETLPRYVYRNLLRVTWSN